MSAKEKNPAAGDPSIDAQAILKKFDKESDYRTLTGLAGKLVAAFAISFTVFQLYTAVFGVFDAMIQRSIHLAFGLSLIFLLYPTSKKWRRDRIHPLDGALAVLGALAPLYIVVFYQALVARSGTATPLDIAFGIVGIFIGPVVLAVAFTLLKSWVEDNRVSQPLDQ